MPSFLLKPKHLAAAGAAALLTLAVAPNSLANETVAHEASHDAAHDSKHQPAKAEAESADAGHAAEAPKPAAGKPAAKAPDEAMEQLRQRLAERLGAKPAVAAGSPYDVRVAARSPEPAPRKVAAASLGSGGSGHGAHGDVAAAPMAMSTLAPPADLHWEYNGETGPQSWGRLKPEFAQCGSGTRQSPIDIRDGIAVQLDPVKFDYRPSAFNVIDNGHTVQVNVGPGNSIEVLGRRYDLVQFHFHRPSEERINGRAFDMVAHLVHKDAEGHLAVVAVLLDRGSKQPIVQSVWNNLPLEKNDPVVAQSTIDLNQLLPEDRRYYTYMGSLTTPPCSEGVLWMVMKTPIGIAPEQVAIFARLYPMNARPVQATAGRLIKESN